MKVVCAESPRYNLQMIFIKLKNRWQKEKAHFKALSPDVRHLLISYYLYLMAYPLFAVFINAYLWRQGEDLNRLLIFNLFYCLGLPLGFYANGLLLKRFHTLKLYWAGGVLEALSGVLIVLIPNNSQYSLIFYGLLSGLGAGLYWGNKNYLSMRLTKGTNRLYYNSMESVGDMMINMIIPAIAGWFIVFGEKVDLYVPETAYKWLMLIGLLLVIISGYIVQSSKIKDINREPLWVRGQSKNWSLVRWYNMLSNIVIGAEFVIPSVLILVLVGKEGVLGLVTSAAAVLSAMCLYILGRKGSVEKAWKTVGLADAIYLGGAVILAIFYSPVSVLLYMAVSTIGWAFRWSPSYAVIMEAMDQENTESGQYAYVCDNELTFNIGRTLGLTLIFVVATMGQEMALRYVPLILGITSFLALIPLVKLSKRVLWRLPAISSGN